MEESTRTVKFLRLNYTEINFAEILNAKRTGLLHEAIYKVLICSKGFHSKAMETTCTKNYSGKLASQDNFCAFCLRRMSGKTF
jgi:hypothetical protein